MSDQLDLMKVSELKELAKKRGIKKYYSMRKADLLRALADVAEAVEEVVEEVVEEAAEAAEEAAEAMEEVAEIVAEEVVEAAEAVEEFVEEVVEEAVEAAEEAEEEAEEEDDVSHLYPKPGDIIELLEDGRRELVVSARLVESLDGSRIDVRFTDGTILVINSKKRHKEVLNISGGIIDFWPPEGARIIRDGKQILPMLPEKVRWYQFWKWFR